VFALLAVLCAGMALPSVALAEGNGACHCPCAATSSTTSNEIVPSFLAISVPTLRAAQILPADKQIATAYINAQLALYGLTFGQYLALDTVMQRSILELPGRQSIISREELRKIVPLRISVPTDVIKAMVPNAVISEDTVEKYAVSLPSTVVNGSILGKTQHVLIADRYILLDSATRRIVDSITL